MKIPKPLEPVIVELVEKVIKERLVEFSAALLMKLREELGITQASVSEDPPIDTTDYSPDEDGDFDPLGPKGPLGPEGEETATL